MFQKKATSEQIVLAVKQQNPFSSRILHKKVFQKKATSERIVLAVKLQNPFSSRIPNKNSFQKLGYLRANRSISQIAKSVFFKKKHSRKRHLRANRSSSQIAKFVVFQNPSRKTFQKKLPQSESFQLLCLLTGCFCILPYKKKYYSIRIFFMYLQNVTSLNHFDILFDILTII